jgi:spore germination protein GerM
MAKKKKTLGCLFWISLVLIVVVVFIANQKNIRDVLRKTGFRELFEKETDEPPEVTINPPPQTGVEAPGVEAPGVEAPGVEAPGVEAPALGTPDPETVADGTIEEPEAKQTSAPDDRVSEADESEKPNIRYANIYLVAVREDGEIRLQAVTREVRFDDSPLRETLLELLKGQSGGELSQGLRSQIPSETALLNVYVRDDTAFIDFSESFRFNPLGQEGLEAQLKQVVYTTLEFSNIKNVQILIEGKVRRYLGPEGIFIGQPLSTESFS